MTSFPDTIYALSSGTLPAGVAVIRISGKDAFVALRLLTGSLPEPRVARLMSIRDREGRLIDKGLVLTFPSPHSFTGEDCAEIHAHGGRGIVTAIGLALEEMPGVRLAEAGEFSRRAFENGKMDLVEAEGLIDLIAAETEMQRRLAAEQSFGGRSGIYEDWASRLTRARAFIEAELDFSDEEDVPGSVSDRIWDDVQALSKEVQGHVEGAKTGEIIRDGFKVAIIGPPNVGKSSLINALAQRDLAIVTNTAGTTRDVLQVDIDLSGYLVRFFDTAGLRETCDAIEQEGIRRAKLIMENADLILSLQENDSIPQRYSVPEKTILYIGTKADLLPSSGFPDVEISTLSGLGIDTLKQKISSTIESATKGSMAPGRARQLSYLRECSGFIQEALQGQELSLRAESLRLAASSLGRITGRVDTEQLLDVIFSQFCIGK